MNLNKQKKKEGYLYKWTNYAGGYQKRWFVVLENDLFYYKNKKDNLYKRKYVLKNFSIKKDKKNKFSLVIRGDLLIHHLDLKTETKEDKANWILFLEKINRSKKLSFEEDISILENTISQLREDFEDFENFSILKCLKKNKDGKEKKEIKRIINALENVVESIKQEEIKKEQFEKVFVEQKNKERFILQKYQELWKRCGEEKGLAASDLSYNLLCKRLDLSSIEESCGKSSIEEVFYDVEEIKSLSKKEHRKELPVESTKVPSMNLFKFLKNAIGRDLTRIPMPINFAEPLSFLQRLCENIEYSELIDKACLEKESERRLLYVTAFAISGYSSTRKRLTKPFNPLLGETFEYIDEKKGIKYISEQTSHHPPISACHCEGEGFVYWSEVKSKISFSGNSLCVIPEGCNHVYLKKYVEQYSWKMVNTTINNIVFGKKYIEHHGELIVENHLTKEKSSVFFLKKNNNPEEYGVISGKIINKNKEVSHRIIGKWTSELEAIDCKKKETFFLWKANKRPENSMENYNFTEMAIRLNELTEENLCPTDSRLRLDQRLMEKGEWDNASKEKFRLEDKQRKQRNEIMPKWFSFEEDFYTKKKYWKYKGEYWTMKGHFDTNSFF